MHTILIGMKRQQTDQSKIHDKYNPRENTRPGKYQVDELPCRVSGGEDNDSEEQHSRISR